MGNRLKQLEAWTTRQLGISSPTTLYPVAGDASQRRYYRVCVSGDSWIAVDAPPDSEKNAEYCAISNHLRRLGLTTPEVLHADITLGFLIISDLGQTTYSDAILQGSEVTGLYDQAITSLITMQTANCKDLQLPVFDAAFCRREVDLFNEWFLGGLLGLEAWSEFDQISTTLWLAIEKQPRVFMHRDYHSRNLMVLDNSGPGILDFQDAVIGPLSYDLVSLLRDCYHNWPETMIATWKRSYLKLARQNALITDQDVADFDRWFDLTGMQRHLKCAGIFARLSIRDDKHHYLNDIPRVIAHIRRVSGLYAELAGFTDWLDNSVLAVFKHITDERVQAEQ